MTETLRSVCYIYSLIHNTMNYAYKTIGQWTKHLITISRDRFGKDIGELTEKELSEASQIIKDSNNY